MTLGASSGIYQSEPAPWKKAHQLVADEQMKPIDLFSLYVLFSYFRPHDVLMGICLFFFISCAYICTCWDDIWKKLFPRVASRGLKWENKTYKLKRSIEWVKHNASRTLNCDVKTCPRNLQVDVLLLLIGWPQDARYFIQSQSAERQTVSNWTVKCHRAHIRLTKTSL